jgi:hypothetical protein
MTPLRADGGGAPNPFCIWCVACLPASPPSLPACLPACRPACLPAYLRVLVKKEVLWCCCWCMAVVYSEGAAAVPALPKPMVNMYWPMLSRCHT